MILKPIKTKLLLKSTIAYRVTSIILEAALLWLITKNLRVAIATALGLNAMHTVWYWIYHYYFARLFDLHVGE